MMKRLLMKRVLVPGLLALLLIGAAFAAVEKFTFNNVTFPDGTTGEIEAGVKTTNKSTVAVCNYYTDGYYDYLGMYQESDGFASTDEDQVLAFCLEHYEDRQ